MKSATRFAFGAAVMVAIVMASEATAQGYSAFSGFVGLDAAQAGSVLLRVAPLSLGHRRTDPESGEGGGEARPGGIPGLPAGYAGFGGALGSSGGAPNSGGAQGGSADGSTEKTRDRDAPELPGILVSTIGGDPDTSVFSGYSRPGHPVEWNDGRAVRADVTPERMLAALAAIAGVREATGGIVDSMGVCLLTLVRGRDDSLQVYEVSLALGTAARLFRILAPQLGATRTMWDALSALACGCMIAPPAGGDDRARLDARIDRIAYDPITRELSGRLLVRNRSSEPIAGPISVVVRPGAESIRLQDPDGVTCRVFAPGAPLVRISGDALAPGAAIERRVRFANPRQLDAKFDLRVFAGERDF